MLRFDEGVYDHRVTPSPTSRAKTVGFLIGARYRVLSWLGEGGMATVYQAEDIAQGRVVALKQLRSVASELRPQLTALFKREYLTLAQLSHPRIVTVYDYAIDADELPFYTMELLDGGDLQKRSPLPYREACVVGRDICSALALLHSRRLVYRDLSPQNVRCTSSGAAKLIDFGAMTPMGVAREIVGTAPFTAPETLEGEALDAGTDLFALGATLYFALTGRNAFPATSLGQLWELWRALPPPPSAYVPDIPEAVDRIVMGLIQLDRTLRPRSASEVMQQLEAAAGDAAEEHALVHQSYLTAPALVGREDALAAVRQALTAAAHGKGRSVLVRGVHGAGLSRFLDECALEAKLQGALVLRAGGNETDHGDYALIRALGSELLQAAPELAQTAAAPRLSVLGRILPELLASAPPALEALNDAQLRERAPIALAAWFHSVAQQRSLCLVVHDAFAADPPSLAVLNLLTRELASTKLALIWSAANEERGTPEYPMALMLLERASVGVELSLLTLEQTRELLASVFGDVPNLGQLAAYAQQTTSGNLRDLLHLLHHLVSEGAISYAGGSWSLANGFHTAVLPSSMNAALRLVLTKLHGSALLLAYALASEPRLRFSIEECSALVDVDAAHLFPSLTQLLDLGLIAASGADYRVARLGLVPLLQEVITAEDQRAQHRRIARLFRQRGDGFREAQHLFIAGDHSGGLDILLQTSEENQRRTDANILVYFETLKNLPADWIGLYEQGVALCTQLERPARDRDILLGRLVGFVAVAHSARGVEGFALMRVRLAQLQRDVGLDLYMALPETLEPGVRLRTALEQAKQRFDAAPAHARVFDPMSAIRPLTTTLLSALGMISVTNDIQAARQLPSMAPLIPLSPALWVIEQTVKGVAARIEGRFDTAAIIYEELIARMEAPDRAGLQPTESRSTTLRLYLSLATLEACMGIERARTRVDLIANEAGFESQTLMLRHLCELWQGQLRAAESTKRELEELRALSNTHNNFEGQHLLGELCALALVDDLTGVRRASESSERMAALHPTWQPVVHYGRGEYQRIRGDLDAARKELETSLRLIEAQQGHQLWPNVAGTHLRVLLAQGQGELACKLGAEYLARAETLEIGYLANYIRMPLSQALAACDQLEAATQMADSAIENLQRLGSGGMNLSLAYDARARLAQRAGDEPAFLRYSGLSVEHGGQAGRRLERARRTHLTPALDASELASELAATLQTALHLHDRAQRALTVLCRRAGAEAGAIYWLSDATLECIARCGDVGIEIELDAWAKLHFEGQVKAQDAATSELDAMEASGAKPVSTARSRYLPIMLGQDSEDGHRYTGIVVLVAPSTNELRWTTSFGSALTTSLAAASEFRRI